MKDDFLIRITENHIASIKRILRTYYGMIILNLMVVFYNTFTLYKGILQIPWLGGAAIGSCGCTCLWLWAFVWETSLDLRLEKQKLEWLKREDELKFSKDLSKLMESPK